MESKFLTKADQYDLEHPEKDLQATGWFLPGESVTDYQERHQKESGQKIEKLASALAHGALRTPGQVRRLAQELGCGIQHIEHWKLHPRITRRVAEILRIRALYATAQVLDSQTEKAKEDVSAFRTLAQISEVLDTGGVKVQSNTVIDQRNGGDNESDRRFFMRFRDRVSGALVSRLSKDQADGPENRET